jgi:hypothetical protein
MWWGVPEDDADVRLKVDMKQGLHTGGGTAASTRRRPKKLGADEAPDTNTTENTQSPSRRRRRKKLAHLSSDDEVLGADTTTQSASVLSPSPSRRRRRKKLAHPSSDAKVVNAQETMDSFFSEIAETYAAVSGEAPDTDETRERRRKKRAKGPPAGARAAGASGGLDSVGAVAGVGGNRLDDACSPPPEPVGTGPSPCLDDVNLVGDKVEARCSGSTKYQTGEIKRDNRDGTFDVVFDDGNRDMKVPEGSISKVQNGAHQQGTTPSAAQSCKRWGSRVTVTELLARSEFAESAFHGNLRAIKTWDRNKIKASEFPRQLKEWWGMLDRDKSQTLCKEEFKSAVTISFQNENLLHKNKLDKKFQLFVLQRLYQHFEAEVKRDPSIVRCGAASFKQQRIISNAIAQTTVALWRDGRMPTSGHTNIERFRDALFVFQVMDPNFECKGQKLLLAPFSLNCISVHNPVRRLAARLVTHKQFDNFILLCIVANSLCLALVDYEDVGNLMQGEANSPNWRNRLLEETEVVFTVAFTVECVLKILALGLYDFPAAYLRDNWNCMDFVVVCAGLATVIPGMPTVSWLRTIRVMRPLRTLSSLPGMRKLITSLLEALPGLFNVMLLLLFVFTILGIMGLQVNTSRAHERERCSMRAVAANHHQKVTKHTA